VRDIVFAHTHTKYDSYTDYYKLAQTGGFEICNVDQIDVNRNATYIVCPHNGEADAALKARPKNQRKCKVALWFLERPAGKFPEFVARTKELLETQIEYCIFSDRAMHSHVKHLHGTVFVPGGSHTALGSLENRDKHYDFCHMSYNWGRRGNVLNELPTLKIGENCWGEQRHDTLLRSKFMVNVHQDADNFHEPLRFALCAAYGIPMISETCFDPYPYEDGKDIITAPYGQMKARIHQALKEDYTKYRDIGRRMWEKAVGPFSFVSNVKKYVGELP
jgi:hypothetical protein